MIFQWLIIAFASSLAGVGIWIAIWGAYLETRYGGQSPQPRGLVLIVAGTLMVAVAGMMVTVAAKIIG